MTTYAFDIDGTLTRNEIKQLANDLYIANHHVIVITGGLTNTTLTKEEYCQRIKEREKQLYKLGVKYTNLCVCIGKNTDEVANQKAEVCKLHKAILMFEDTPKYIDVIERQSTTVGLLVNKTKK